jgi:hypothetical protein
MLVYGPATTVEGLKAIQDLQKANLPDQISEPEAIEQGFVTVLHALELLSEMNEALTIIVWHGGTNNCLAMRWLWKWLSYSLAWLVKLLIMHKKILLWGICTLAFYALGAQPVSDASYELTIRKSNTAIKLDGVLDEEAWQIAETCTGFYQNFPFDTSKAELQTKVWVTFGDQAIYIGAEVQQAREDYIIASLKRDFSQGPTDEFAVNIDPFKDKINGFHFAVSPLNVQREGLIDNGNNIPTDWDNKWYSAVTNYDDYWVVEMAIPFKTIRYKTAKGENSWRINFSRTAVKQNERSSWVPVPRQFNPNSLAFTALLHWGSPPPKAGLNVSLIPYLAAAWEEDLEFNLPAETSLGVGGDAKIGLTPSLNLDLTFNPDFSQVEVDRQITNLSRFELFFPERRQFFLENEDLFSRFGFPNSRPFFSRRIGLARGVITKEDNNGQTIEVNRSLNVPITAGARISGKLNNNWRLGVLNMQTAAADELGLDPANYTVGVIQRKVFDRSYVGAIVANKENFMENSDGSYEWDREAYNRVVGLEYNLFSKDNKWEAELFYHRSISKGNNEDAQSAALFVGRFTREWRLFLPSQYIGSGYRADMGFVPRTGFFSTSPGITRTFFPKQTTLFKNLISYSVGLNSSFIFNQPDYRMVDQGLGASFSLDFPGSSSFSANVNQSYTYLFFPFDPTNSEDGVPLPEGSDYTYYTAELSYDTDQRKRLYAGAGIEAGSYFNGDILRAQGVINYRWQPYGILALSIEYNSIQLPETVANFWLVGPRAELSFSRTVFFSAFFQYNTQVDNFNINARLQWRYKPVSDFFIVYTDNYFTENLFLEPRAKNRALVLKATYWLNL